MAEYTTEAIRNVALVGHGASGKTTLAEAVLVNTSTIAAKGSLERGTTVSDFEPEEKRHGHSLVTAVIGADVGNVHINILDTPGYPDFLGRALPALAAVETAAVVIDARSGVQTNTRRMMEAASERGLCRILVVNKIDAEDVDFDELIAQLREAFGDECLPINLPTADRRGVVDVFFAADEAPTAFSTVEDAHTQIVDQVVEMDDTLMEVYLEEGALDSNQLHDAFEKALREGHLIPICFTSADNDVGVTELVELFVKLLPNPTEGNPPPIMNGDQVVALSAASDSAPVAHVFKVSIDPFVGRLAVFRVHQGSVTKDTQFLVGDARKPFRVGHLFKIQGKDHVEVDRAVPGDICAIAKIDDVGYNAVLHTSHEEDSLSVAPVPVPASMYGLAIEAKTRGDEQKLSDTLHKLVAEISFVVEHNAALKETVVRGLGELHLRMMLERMSDRYNVEVDTRPPRIPYRETITGKAEGHHRHKKQTGGAGQFGEVFLRIEPLGRGDGFEFVDRVVGGVIPGTYIPAVEKGVREIYENGAIAGYGMQDIRVTLYDGKHHPVDSKEIAFVQAGKKAFLDAIHKAKPIVLEPVVEMEITAPQEKMGDIAGDLSGKRGRVSGTNALAGGMVSVTGQAPLSELENYQSELKSVTGGAGSYSMSFSHYDPAPRPIQDQQLTSEYRPAADDD